MAELRILQDVITNEAIYPYTVSEAVIDENGNSVIETIKSDLSEVNETLGDIMEIEIWNIADKGTILEATYINGDTVATNQGTFYTIQSIPVEPNTIYYYDCEKHLNGHNSRFLNFRTADKSLISTLGWDNGVITTPSNCAYIDVTFWYVDEATQDKGFYFFTDKEEGFRTDKQIIKGDNITEMQNDIDEMRNISVQKLRKPTFCFVFDDGTDGDVNTKALFDSYGMKCGFALLSSESDISRYLNYQSEGFEILSHSTDGTEMSADTIGVAEIEAKMKNSKDLLAEQGFKINGWVTPSTWLNDIYFPSLCKYYEYGFGHKSGNESTEKIFTMLDGRDIRQIERWSLQANNVTSTIAKIDECISANGFLCFYGHTYPDTSGYFTEENMSQIMTYLKTKVDNGEIIVDIPNNAVNDYFALRYSDLLKLIN